MNNRLSARHRPSSGKVSFLLAVHPVPALFLLEDE